MKHKAAIHVLHIITKLEMGGAQKVCLCLKKELPKQGISTGLISGIDGELVSNITDVPNTTLINELVREVSATGAINEIRCFFKLISLIRATKKQYPNLIVHTHSTKAGLMGRWASFFAGAKRRVHTIHGFGFHRHQLLPVRFFIYFLELVTSLITTHFVCVSSTDVKRALRIFPNFAKKHSIIRAAVDWQNFSMPERKGTPFPIDEIPFVFGSIGCLRRGKNHFDLLQAFEHIHKKRSNARLEIIGEGILRPKLERWIQEHNLQEHITLCGWQHNVSPIMQRWHAFVFSSLWEGMPCSIIEARLLKIPVLSYETGGIRDVISPGINGFLYKQHDWQSLAQGMLTLMNDPTLYHKLQSYQDDLTDYNDHYMIQQHVALYKNL